MELQLPIIIVVVVAIIGFAIVHYWMECVRREKMRAMASQLGLAYVCDKDGDFDGRHNEFGCLREGHSRYARHIVQGSWQGRRVTLFDYHYTTGSGKHQQHHRLSCVLVNSQVPLRPLLIRPEHFGDKMAAFFGAEDINFESAEFSRRFYVKSSDRRWAYDVLHAQTIEFLLGTTAEFHIQFGSGSAMAWREHCLEPEGFLAGLQVIAGVLDRLPDYVVKQQLS